ncbi:DUF4178 domain-containing protein [Jannaschia formosa]|uniref:DUF4178 domain-containing protein n=1 Tax=Jannaschia formosa TaxID=2259592 RepID=UPI000E1BD160|nr:DUF4178 domain-containing protein [Jannaschia formosa]TFL19586.1 DUF4178 domain-containing protein [Jannaschia formosa]
MTGTVSAINCTNCGAGLEVLGGGRVVTQVCGYCGARLDANDAYRVLSVHAGMVRPDTPFRLGMTGEIDGVRHTIIGTLGYVERWGGQEWRWVDHMLYSATHGYAWLTVEDGHTLLTRKVRDWPDASFLTAQTVELVDTRPVRTWRGRSYRYYASSSWEIDFVEGEFTWRPERGQRGSAVSLMPTGRASDMLTYADGGEREIEVTRYFPEAAATFGAEALRPQGVHPLQPYEAKRGKRFYGLWFAAMTVAALAIAMAVTATSGARVTLFHGPPADLPAEMSFEVASTTRPVRLQLFQDLAQSWAEYEMTLTDPAGTVLAQTGRGISYYYGGSGEDAWSEGSRFASLTFEPTVPGRYLLEMAPDQVDPGASRAPLRLTVQEGRGAALWSWIAAGLFAVAFLWTLSAGWRHRMARWKGSDWTEEDD